MIEGIDHLVLTVADLDATLDFYAGVLQTTIVRTEGKPAALVFGRQKINVHPVDHTFEPKAAQPTPGAGDFCLITALPLGEVRERIEASGVVIEEGPIARTGARGAMTSIYCRDPDGNLVEISRYD